MDATKKTKPQKRAQNLKPAQLASAKPDPKRRREIPDGYVPGLFFIVQPGGARSWTVRYRQDGQQKKIGLGSYRAGSDPAAAGAELTAKRAEASAILESKRKGADPKAVRKEAAIEAEGTTYEAVVRRFVKEYAQERNRRWEETARALGLVVKDGELVPREGGLVELWGVKQIDTITKRNVIDHLNDTKDKAGPYAANRRLSALSKFFNWAGGEDILKVPSPCTGVAKRGVETSRERVLSNVEMRALLQACGKMGYPWGTAVELLARCGQRRTEVMAMRREEVAGNLWSIPGDRSKNEKPHDVHLTARCVELLASTPMIGNGELYFTTTGSTPVSGYARAKQQLDRKMLEIMREADPDATLEEWVFHDLRRTAVTRMAELKISSDIADRVLNHVTSRKGGVKGVYQRFEFLEERKEALEVYGAHLDTLLKAPEENSESQEIAA